jgi:hypothetical protein
MEPELDLLLRRLADPISSRGSVVLKVGLRHGRSTSRATHLVQLPGNNVQLLLDLLVEQLPGSSDLEDMIVTNVVAAAKVAVLRRGSSPGLMTEDRIITMVVVTVVVVTAAQEEVMDKVRLLEAQLPGISRNNTQATVHPAWTITVRHLLRRRLETFRRRRRRRIMFPLPHHRRSREGLAPEPRSKSSALRVRHVRCKDGVSKIEYVKTPDVVLNECGRMCTTCPLNDAVPRRDLYDPSPQKLVCFYGPCRGELCASYVKQTTYKRLALPMG